MNFEEHAAKPLLEAAGIAIPRSRLARSAGQAQAGAAELGGSVVVKAQVPTGKRGKAGGNQDRGHAGGSRRGGAGDPRHGHRGAPRRVRARRGAGRNCRRILRVGPERRGVEGSHGDVHARGRDGRRGGGGIDARSSAAHCGRHQARARSRIRARDARRARARRRRGADRADLVALYRAYRDNDAELLEVNPLARLEDGRLVALDCKFTLDDSGIKRREALAARGSPERLTGLEARGQALGLKYIELDGDVGVLANGAGLTMTSMDVITHCGGRPANFLEIGGDAYTKATPALELVLDNPRVKSLVVNFCGAFARTDVMTGGVLDAWEALEPSIPVFFSVHGTGAAEARAMLRERLGVIPYETMDEAIAAAVAAVRETDRSPDGNGGQDTEADTGGDADGSTGRGAGGAS